MADAISNTTLESLRALAQGWDLYGGKPPTEQALTVLEVLHITPASDGGLQIEWHANHWDVEIEVNSAGEFAGVYAERVKP